MTIVIVAFRDDAKKAVAYKKFTNTQCAAAFYHRLLERAMFEAVEKKPRVISTRIILDD